MSAQGAMRDRVGFGAVTTERLEADVQTTAAMLAAATCEWLLMIAELDRREAWLSWECRSMAHWLSWKCALSLRTGREHVRVARELERLPRARAEFGAGRLSYSKVRTLTRIVSAPELEADLVELALVATAAQLDSLATGCSRVARNNDPDIDARNHDNRSWALLLDDDGTGTITMHGPTDLLCEVLAAVDQAEKRETANDAEGLEARRFDAALTIARRSLSPDPEAAPATTIVIRAEAAQATHAIDELEPDPAVPIRAHGLPISRAAYERLRCDAAVALPSRSTTSSGDPATEATTSATSSRSATTTTAPCTTAAGASMVTRTANSHSPTAPAESRTNTPIAVDHCRTEH